MEAKLVVLAPAEIVNTEFKLQLPVTIGRGRDAKIKLVHGQISRLHCEVYEDNGQLKARDLGSLNGTFVDGERISDADLNPGGTLNVGAVTFRAVYGDMPVESDDSAVEFGAPRITDTVSTTSTVMEDAFPDFGQAAAAEHTTAADEDELEMFDFTEKPAAAAPPVPAPVADAATIATPSPLKADPNKAPPAPAKEADVDDWLNIESTESADKPADDDDLQSFFGNLK